MRFLQGQSKKPQFKNNKRGQLGLTAYPRPVIDDSETYHILYGRGLAFPEGERSAFSLLPSTPKTGCGSFLSSLSALLGWGGASSFPASPSEGGGKRSAEGILPPLSSYGNRQPNLAIPLVAQLPPVGSIAVSWAHCPCYDHEAATFPSLPTVLAEPNPDLALS